MWFHLGFKNFIAKKSHNDDFCDIFISDFIHIWHKSLSNDEILSISKKLNPLFEAPVLTLRDLTLNLLGDEKAEKKIEVENNNILLKLESYRMNVMKFQFQIILSQGDGEMFYKEFTLPVLLALIKMQNTEKKIIEIVKDKDAEIKEYKQEYGITSNYLTTKSFSEKEFYSEESSTTIPWDNTFLDCINSKIITNETNSKVKKDDSTSEMKSVKMQSVDKSDNTNYIFKDKSLNQNNGSKPCILLDNKVIKKKRKLNDGFKIKL